MRKILLLAVLAVFVVVPAYASVQNVKVSGDIDSTMLVRDQFDLGFPGDERNQNFLFTQSRLRVDSDLTDNVSATIRLLNERVWGADTGSTSENEEVELNLAYVTLREMLYSPLTVIIGRQDFRYGNSFVIDSAGPNNTTVSGGLNGIAEDLTKRTSQDAVRMVLDYNPLTIDLVASKINDGSSTGSVGTDDDIDLYGTNVNYQLGDDMNTVVEGYFWSKIDQSVQAPAGALVGYKADTVYMPGAKVSSNIMDNLSLSAEGAWQFGNKTQVGLGLAGDRVNMKRDAFGAQIMANYKVPVIEQYKPMLTAGYTYVSGESGVADGKNPADKDERYDAWDPMFENQGGGKIINTIFNLTNNHIATIRGQINPMEDLAAIVEWNGLWLAKEIKDSSNPDKGTSTVLTLLQPDGSNISSFATTSNKHLGDEFDAKLVYDYTEDVQIGAMMGWFFPGDVFADTNDEIASQYMVNANVNF